MPQVEPGMPVTVFIDGQEHPIRYSLRTLKELQKEHGISLLRGASDAMLDPEKLAVVLAYGLRGAMPDITPDWVEDHVDAASLVAMIPALSQAISGRPLETSLPNAETARRSGIGSPSGPSDDTTYALVNGRSGG